jgi:hypothetical protein
MLCRSIVAYLLLPLSLFSTEFTFTEGSSGWEGDFADYPVEGEAYYELSWGWENLPLPLDSLTKGLFLGGKNQSDDLFMFVRHRIDGLKANTSYYLDFTVIVECNTPAEAIGIGGAPGESLYFKVGASTEKPCKVAQEGYYFLNVDKGNQSTGGASAQVIGDLANPAVTSEDPHYQPKDLYSTTPLLAKTDANGSLWIFLGTDSGFEGATRFYIAKISLDCKEIPI